MNKEIKKTDVFYHYCSVETFFKIISNKSIWLSDISKSNDSEEITWALKQCTNYLFDLMGEYQKSLSKEEITDEDSKKMFQEARDLISFHINKEAERYWVLCLSDKKDDLGQWRGYSQDASGVAIGLRAEYIARLVGDNAIDDCDEKLHFDSVEYYKQFEVNSVFSQLNDNNKNISDMSKDEFYSYIKKIVVFSLIFAPYIKSDYFEDESEWRIAYKMSCSELHKGRIPSIENEHLSSKYEYSLNRGKLISHLELILKHPSDAIASIWLGPKCTLSKREVKLFLIANGYLKNMEDNSIEIHTSGATYR